MKSQKTEVICGVVRSGNFGKQTSYSFSLQFYSGNNLRTLMQRFRDLLFP